MSRRRLAGAGASLLDRVEGAATTFAGLDGFKDPIDWLVGGLIVATLVGGAWCLTRGAARRPLGLALAGIALLLYVMRVGAGLGFVPGLLTASPIAAVGAFAIWTRRDARLLALLAWCALPLVWVSQYSGGATAAVGWPVPAALGRAVRGCRGGRARRRSDRARRDRGVLGRGDRIRVRVPRGALRIGRGGDGSVVDRGDVRFVGQRVISLDPHLFREGGAATTPIAHWLTATDDRELARAVHIMRDARDRGFTILVPEEQRVPRVDGYVPSDVVRGFRVRPDLTIRAVNYHAP